ncbi:uncharacterized protein LOC107363458 [Tetranychus urticae]|uniref:uncharacterized protein LOC107363458 n=1 Tax=Tetranychus urticae TaxID=32264 RepID=UPI00077BC100|nr:uncharacterized protein LOC107363458 [Tetranychus urticae]
MNTRREHKVLKAKSKKTDDDDECNDESKHGLSKLNDNYGSFRHVIKQDINGIKTVVLRLQGLLHNFESSNPLDKEFTSLVKTSDNTTNKLSNNEFGKKEVDLIQENIDLKRKVTLLEQQLEEKNRTIKLLQQQMVRPEASGRRTYGHKKQLH